ncbi:MAG: threonine synthase [Cellulosilyticaceae bacterium]
MEMRTYTSTRSHLQGITAKQAILQGISEDGGLFVPEKLPVMDFVLEEMMTWDYKKLAYRVMRLFFEDFTEEELRDCIEHAYDEKFDTAEIAPLVSTSKTNYLELFHGPTLAFKDMALSILPYLMLTSKKASKDDAEIVILTATSGDTGKAALEGFAGVEGTKIIVFFPEEGVSSVQKRQMTTQEGDNTLVIGINGNFDDAQTGVKELFGDRKLEAELKQKGYVFSSANSINIGRLIPQVVYYFHAYKELVNKGKLTKGEPMNVVVPTGNFGNILAAYYAKALGLPISKFICASNQNKVLFDFFETGTYNRKREFHITSSPSMDILISSNLERLLYHISGEDTEAVSLLMNALKEQGEYSVNETMKNHLQAFYGGYADDVTTAACIKKVFEEEGYLMDTHTAVAYAVFEDYTKATGDYTPCVIASTASPYKFTGSVMEAIDEKYSQCDNDFALLDEMEKMLEETMPVGIQGLESRPIRHTKVCEVNEMKQVVCDFLV